MAICFFNPHLLHRLEIRPGTHRGTRRSLHRDSTAESLASRLREEMKRPLFEAPTTPHFYGRQTKHPHPSRDDFSHLNHFKSNVRCIVTVVAEQNNSFSKVSGLLRNLPMSNQLSDPVTPQMLTRFAYSSAKTADLSQIREAQAIVTVLRSGPFDLSSSSVILSICGPQSPSAALTMSSNH